MATTKKGKVALAEFENQTKELRQLLSEQLKLFDARMEGKVWFLADIQEYYRRMAELESEYSKNLEKIAERFNDRLSKYKSQRKERSTTIDLWQQVLNDTKNRAKKRHAYSENLINNIVNRFLLMSDDYQRVFKKCREAGSVLQEELLRVVTELHRKQRRYYALVSETKTSEAKLKSTEHALQKSEESGRRNEKITKQKDKHQQRYSENKRKSIKAKNEYIMYLQATNKFLQTYFNKNISDLIDGFDFNCHDSFKSAIEAYCTAECTLATSTIQGIDTVREIKMSVEPETDKQYLFEDNQSVLNLPFTNFSFLPFSEEENFQISPQQLDIVDHHCDLFRKLKQIKAETDEIQKTVEATSDALKNMYKQWDNEMIKIAAGQVEMSQGVVTCQSIKSSCEELELYYVSKFKENMMTNTLRIQLEAQNDILTRALGEVTEDTVGRRTAYHKQLAIDTKSPKAAAILDSVQKKTKIFGCNMSEYLKITGRQIPEVVESCVRFIKKFGLDHPGIFRLSGSTTDINDMKQLFEAGRDPLAGLNHWKDINAVSGLLRVYFRELEDSLFPKSHYKQFLEATMNQPSEEDLIKNVAGVVSTLPEEIIAVMRFLFRFIHQVAEHHEQNKMDAHNLAVVFGPTLLRIPSEQDMIAYQSHVNSMMEVIIKHPEEIFPTESETDSVQLSEPDDDSEESDEDFCPRDAEALYDYSARSGKELSFKKGDIIRVFKRFNKDWWDGTLNDTDGFVPATYIKMCEVDNTDSVPLSPTGDLPKSSSVISPGDNTLQRPKDLNGPPRIPKREGSLKKRFDAPIRLSSGASSPSEARPSSQTSTPFGTKSGGFRIAISTDDILNKQKHLRALHKDEPSTPENISEELPPPPDETPKSSTLPRNHGSPLVSSDDLTMVTDKEDTTKKNDNETSFEKRAYSLDLDKTPDETKSLIWQVRDTAGGTPKQAETPPSPRSSFAPRIPPAVKPKPKGGRGSNPPPPSRGESDLLQSIHAAQAARTHRTNSDDKDVTEEKRRESQGSTGDDTQLS